MKLVMDIQLEIEIEDFDGLEIENENDFGKAVRDGKLSMRCSSGTMVAIDDDDEEYDDFCEPDEIPTVFNGILDEFMKSGVLSIGEKA